MSERNEWGQRKYRNSINPQYYKDVLESADSIHPKCPNCNKNLLNDTSCNYCGWVIEGIKQGIKQEVEQRSRRISKAVQRDVWRRDGGRCAECRSRERLEYDHIIPFSKGGSNTTRNIELLCEKCNRSKNNKIGV